MSSAQDKLREHMNRQQPVNHLTQETRAHIERAGGGHGNPAVENHLRMMRETVARQRQEQVAPNAIQRRRDPERQR